MAHPDEGAPGLPRQPIDRVVGPLERFLHVEAASGVLLLICTAVALFLANSPWSEAYLGLWKTKVTLGVGSFQMSHSLQHWINDGLMAVFFFVVGLEVKREIVIGELRDARRAALPLAAAVGGMVVPAGVYLALQQGQPAQDGWGIPMATDIAFVVGCMALLSSRVPTTLRVLLLSLAIADDIGAILVIAIGYTDEIHTVSLMLGFVGLALVFLLGRLGVRSFLVYTIVGALVWLAFHESGVHATIAGVALGLLTPARQHVGPAVFQSLLQRAGEVLQGSEWESLPHRSERVRGFQRAAREMISPVEFLEGFLHPWVGFAIMPVFALANAGVPFEVGDLGDPVALAVAAGLVVGKPVGIVGASWLAVRVGLARLPDGVGWLAIVAGGALSGIGFTMALFIAGLALGGDALDPAKVGVLGGSAVSAAIGVFLLSRLPRRTDAA